MLRFITAVLFLSLANAISKTNLSYHFAFQYEPKGDFAAQIILEINVRNPKMVQAVSTMSFILTQIQELGQYYCKQNQFNNCQVILESKQQTITPLYKSVGKQAKFSNFQIQETVTLKVKNVQGIAPFIDELVKLSPEIKMLEFSFVPENPQQFERQSLQAGLQEGFKLCKQMNGKLITITKVEQITDFGLSQDEQEQTEDEQEEQNQGNSDSSINGLMSPIRIEWLFNVVCQLE